MKIAVDTNVLAYAAGFDDAIRVETALAVLRRTYLGHQLVFPAQVMAELFRVLVRKARWSAGDARDHVIGWCEAGVVAPTSDSTLRAALNLAVDHHLQPFDAIILAAASEAGCRILLSEDLQDGFSWSGVTVVAPSQRRPTRCSARFEPAPPALRPKVARPKHEPRSPCPQIRRFA